MKNYIINILFSIGYIYSVCRKCSLFSFFKIIIIIIYKKTPDLTRCSVWILDGDLYHKGLLKFAVTSESLKDSLVVFVVDMSRPWTIMESLQKWASVLREHVDKLKIPPEEMREMEQRSKCCFALLLRGCISTNTVLFACRGHSDSSVIMGDYVCMTSSFSYLLQLFFLSHHE